MPPWKVVDHQEQWWLGLMLDVVKSEPQGERGRKAARRLESGPSEREHAGPVVVVVVPGVLVELKALVVHVAKRMDGVEVVLAGSQMPASDVVLGMRVCESQRVVLVEDVLAWDMAT